MKMPEAVVWSVTWSKCHCGNFFFRREDADDCNGRLQAKFPNETREVVGLFEEDQLREALAQHEAMAASMDMFRDDMINAGVIDANVPPMFMTEAVLGAIQRAVLAERTACAKVCLDVYGVEFINARRATPG